ncbi:hypothetical protein Tco_1506651 [Tanacetum coccineum]
MTIRLSTSGVVYDGLRTLWKVDSPAEEAKTESNVWDDGSEDVNPFGGGNPGFHDDHYDNSLLTKETESEPIIWDIGYKEEEYHFVNKYPSFQKEPIMLVEEESCHVYDTDNEEEESMPLYDTDIKDVIEEEEGFIDETAGSVPKHVAATFATGLQTASPNNVVNLKWGLHDDLRICSFRACKEMITHLATPAKDEFLGGLTNIEVVQRAYQLLGRCVLLQGELLKCHEKLNIKHVDPQPLSKEFALLDSVHSSCEDKERELLDQLKEMERERDD